MSHPLIPARRAGGPRGVGDAADAMRPGTAVRWPAGADGANRADAFCRVAVGHYEQALAAIASRADEGVSLSLAVPFCVAHCLCCGRDVHAAQPAEVISDYVDCLIDEMRAVAARGVAGRDVLQLHLGGGTANEISDVSLVRLMQALRALWRVPADTEMSVDIDPRRAGWSQLQLLRSLGFGRISFGVLDLDPAVQRAIGRLQSAALIEDVCAVARSCGIELITLALMVGLPEQNTPGWRSTLQRIVEIAPDRIALMHYSHQPWNAPSQFAIDAERLPDGDDLRALMALTADALGAAGYCRVGPDLWALDTDELTAAPGPVRRSLISYTVMPEVPLLGLGAGAVGRIDGNTFHNVASLALWRQAVRAGDIPISHAELAGDRQPEGGAAALRLV